MKGLLEQFKNLFVFAQYENGELHFVLPIIQDKVLAPQGILSLGGGQKPCYKRV